MSIWRVNEEASAHFATQLYVQDNDDEQSETDDGEYGDSGDENDEPEDSLRSPSPVAPPYSPLSSPERRESRERSRSPIGLHRQSDSEPLGVILRIFNQSGIPIDAQDGEEDVRGFPLDAQDGDEEGLEGEDGVFFSPDVHALFVCPKEDLDAQSGGRDMKGREKNQGAVRRGRRGVRSTRGRGRHARGCKNQNQSRKVRLQWDVGHPLYEIWSTDEDVPPELVNLVNDVMRKREIRTHRERGARGVASEEEDEFSDASDGTDDLSKLEGSKLHFEWFPMDSFHGKEETFTPERTGSVQQYTTAYDAFRSYWDEDILGLIVAETNQYANKIKSAAFQSEWYPTNIDEILCLFSFWMMLGIVRMPTILSCFSVDPLLKTEVFRRIFTRKRYQNLTRALNFIDCDPAIKDSYSSITGGARHLDRLYRLRPIITHLNSKFQSNYILDKDICIDESLTLWKGKLDIKQYIRTKASKLGIKTFELCESATGYLWSFIVYTGKKLSPDIDHSPTVLKSTTIVKTLMEPLLNKGYRLFMDNWYNSPLLARFLKLNGTDCVGTLRPTRRDVPVLINNAPLQRGELIARHSGDVTVLSWQDKKRITMISTCHGSSTALPRVTSRPLSRPIPYKPQVVLDYNKFMGGVDLKDQMLEPYLLERKRCNKWYMKLFKRLLNVSILNSRTLLQSSTQHHHDHLAFRLHLVDSILTKHLSHCPLSRKFTVSISRSPHEQPGRTIHHTHWPIRLEQTESSMAQSRSFRKRCVVCLREGKPTQKTTYCCEVCKVPLCIDNCFKVYHSSSSQS